MLNKPLTCWATLPPDREFIRVRDIPRVIEDALLQLYESRYGDQTDLEGTRLVDMAAMTLGFENESFDAGSLTKLLLAERQKSGLTIYEADGHGVIFDADVLRGTLKRVDLERLLLEHWNVRVRPVFNAQLRPQSVPEALRRLEADTEILVVTRFIGGSGMGSKLAGTYVAEVEQVIQRQAKGLFTVSEAASILASVAPDDRPQLMLDKMHAAFRQRRLVILDPDGLEKLEGSQFCESDLVKDSGVDAWLKVVGADFRFPSSVSPHEAAANERIADQRRRGRYALVSVAGELAELNGWTDDQEARFRRRLSTAVERRELAAYDPDDMEAEYLSGAALIDHELRRALVSVSGLDAWIDKVGAVIPVRLSPPADGVPSAANTPASQEPEIRRTAIGTSLSAKALGSADVSSTAPANAQQEATTLAQPAQPQAAHDSDATTTGESRATPPVPTLAVNTGPGWTLRTPQRTPGYTWPLYQYLMEAHTAGRPKPKARDVLDAFHAAKPRDVAVVNPDALIYYDAKGNTKEANLAAIAEAIRRMTATPGPR